MERKINETAAITVYPNGYALYEADGAAIVFPVHPCGDYCYGFPPYVCTVSARLFAKEVWYIRLVLEGENRMFRSLETKEQNHTVSFHFAAEDWQELADAEDSVFDCVIQREMIKKGIGLSDRTPEKGYGSLCCRRKNHKRGCKRDGDYSSGSVVVSDQGKAEDT